jgi:hypothetical protein
MIKVRMLQVNTDPKNLRDLNDAVEKGRTNPKGWQMPKNSAPGDLVVWYAAGRQKFAARGMGGSGRSASSPDETIMMGV